MPDRLIVNWNGACAEPDAHGRWRVYAPSAEDMVPTGEVLTRRQVNRRHIQIVKWAADLVKDGVLVSIWPSQFRSWMPVSWNDEGVRVTITLKHVKTGDIKTIDAGQAAI